MDESNINVLGRLYSNTKLLQFKYVTPSTAFLTKENDQTFENFAFAVRNEEVL